MSEPIRLLVDRDQSDGAAATFDAVEHQVGLAAESIDIFMFVWRNDEIGNQLGQAVLAAAERGISVKVIKDRAAIMYERIEMNRKSLSELAVNEPDAFKSLIEKVKAA